MLSGGYGFSLYTTFTCMMVVWHVNSLKKNSNSNFLFPCRWLSTEKGNEIKFSGYGNESKINLINILAGNLIS